MWNFPECIRKDVEFRSLGVLFFGLPYFQTNLETSVEYLQRHFFNYPACFFLEQTTDRQIDLLFQILRYPAHRTDLEPLPGPSQSKICYRLHRKYVFLLFPNNLLVCNLKVFIFTKQELQSVHLRMLLVYMMLTKQISDHNHINKGNNYLNLICALNVYLNDNIKWILLIN